MKTLKVIIINEQHKLTEVQKDLISKIDGDDLYYNIPAGGLTNKQQLRLAESLTISLWQEKYTLSDAIKSKVRSSIDGYIIKAIFISPIPLLMTACAWHIDVVNGYVCDMYLMVNDKREKVENDGVVRYTIPEDGWELIRMCNI